MADTARIAGVASAFPRHYYPQQFLTNELKRLWNGKLENPKLLDRLHAHAGVEGRHLALPAEAYEHLATWGQANQAWIDCAQELGQKAICSALSRAGMAAPELDALFFVSVTGISSPSIDAKLINRMGLNRNLKRVPIFGLGCVAGAAGIARAYDYVRAYPEQSACLLAIELCSLTFRQDDCSTANLISSGLFGDGAAAVIVRGAQTESPNGSNRPRILATRSVFYPGSEHVMGWDISEKGFRVVLSPEVPSMVERHLAADVDVFLADAGLVRSDIGAWVLHPGGPKVLQATQAALELAPEALHHSWESLRKVGNLSSASVLLVLERFMQQPPAPGTYGLLAAMGPGFCSELVLLQW
ncbi:MAG: type III polyketide synthase [Acidobacteria bacterium]|nr:type III polyketide synthase [Acidobacteriota bacterium]